MLCMTYITYFLKAVCSIKPQTDVYISSTHSKQSCFYFLFSVPETPPLILKAKGSANKCRMMPMML